MKNTTQEKNPIYGADPLEAVELMSCCDVLSDMPFFHPLVSDEPDLCYAVIGCIRYKSEYTLLRGQVLPLCNPITGWFNKDVEFVLYLLLAKQFMLETAPSPKYRFNIACAGDPGFGATQLSSESGIYSFPVTSIMGFLGSKTQLLSPIDKTDVYDLVVADGYSSTPGGSTFSRRADGKLSFTPRFYVTSECADDAVSRFDLASKSWRYYVEIEDGPVFFPVHDRSEDFELDHEELKIKLGRRYNHGATIFVGTDTMEGPVRTTAEEAAKAQELLTQLQNTTLGFAAQRELGIRPMLSSIPRMNGPSRLRHNCVQQILNAAGLHSWHRQLKSA